MPSTYGIGRIAARQIDPAYLLVSTITPTLDLASWRAFCAGVLGRREAQAEDEDIIVAVNPLRYVQGVCISAVRRHPALGHLLDVPIFVVASAADATGVAIDLLQHLKAVAWERNCQKIRIWPPGQDNWRASRDLDRIRRSDHGVVLGVACGASPGVERSDLIASIVFP